MKKLLSTFAAYDLWANERLLQTILTLDEGRQQQNIESSFPSLHQTCLHIWDASSIWWQRLHMHEQIAVPSLSFHPTMNDVANGLLLQNKQWVDWLDTIQEADLEKELVYKNRIGDQFRQQVKEILLHLFNHGTYHRGQLVTMLRQLGVEKIPQTDYIVYGR